MISSASFSPPSIRFQRPTFVAAYSSSNTCLSLPKLASSSSLYEVLGISMGATGQDIKAAYRRLARSYHPDVVAVARKDSSADEFIKIHTAYSTLSDPEKRADYDRRLIPVRSYSGVSSGSERVYSRFNGYPRRNWETDQCW